MYTLPFTKLIKDNDDHFDHGIDYLGVSTRAIRVGLITIKGTVHSSDIWAKSLANGSLMIVL